MNCEKCCLNHEGFCLLNIKKCKKDDFIEVPDNYLDYTGKED